MKPPLTKIKKNPTDTKKGKDIAFFHLHKLAFDNSLYANIISTIINGQIIITNRAARKLLGYSKKELLTKCIGDIFDVNESSHRKKAGIRQGKYRTLITAIKKSGEPFPCEVSSAVFMDEDGFEKSITTIVDVIQRISRQKNSDDKKGKIVAGNILRADDSAANISNSGIVLRDAREPAYRIIGFTHDINKQKAPEEKVEPETRLKENQGVKATGEAKETGRLDIEKELDENVNQLLGASRLYLSVAKQGGENSEMFLNRSSEYTLKAIEKIRKLTKGLMPDSENPGLCNSIDNISKNAMEVNPVKISCNLESFMEDSVNDKFKLNVFGIVQDELYNILKYAKATEIAIGLFQSKKSITLSISNNGTGFDSGKKRNGIGVDNVKTRAATYNGTADFVSQVGEGSGLTVTFPVANILLDVRSCVDTLHNRKSILIEKIKNVIIELVHSDEIPKPNCSEYLSKRFHQRYSYLAHLFSESEGITLKKFIVSHKIERVKELILCDELNLTEIAWKLHFSSKAHLSNQFKKITGLTPSFFKQLMNKRHTSLNYV